MDKSVYELKRSGHFLNMEKVTTVERVVPDSRIFENSLSKPVSQNASLIAKLPTEIFQYSCVYYIYSVRVAALQKGSTKTSS